MYLGTFYCSPTAPSGAHFSEVFMSDNMSLELSDEADTTEIAAYFAAIMDAYGMRPVDATAAMLLAFLMMYEEQDTLH
jgi:hypothetical protein